MAISHFVELTFNLFEVAVIETLKALTVASLVLSHLVYGVVYGVKVLLLGNLSQVHLALASTTLSIHALEEVGLRIPNNLTDQLGKLGSVLSLLPSVTLESLSDLGITLTVSLTAHSQVHTYLGALTHEVILQTLPQLGIRTLAVAQLMLRNEIQSAILNNLDELLGAYFAQRALLGSLVTLMNVTTYGTTEFLCHNLECFKVYCFVCLFLFPIAKIVYFGAFAIRKRYSFLIAT